MSDANRPRLACDVIAAAKKSGTLNGRTVPAELNFALRRYYSGGVGHFEANARSVVKRVKFIPACGPRAHEENRKRMRG